MRKIASLMLLLIVACAGPFRGGRALQDGPVSYQVILAGSHSLAKDYSVQLITGEKEWDNIWIVAKGNEQPLPARPTVDFRRDYVIAAFMGERTSSGYKIEITSIEKHGPVLLVHVKKYETPGMLPVITNPFYIVRIPRGNYRLEVSEETVQ